MEPNFYEILDFCGFDIEEAGMMVKTLGADIRRAGIKDMLTEAKGHADCVEP